MYLRWSGQAERAQQTNHVCSSQPASQRDILGKQLKVARSSGHRLHPNQTLMRDFIKILEIYCLKNASSDTQLVE